MGVLKPYINPAVSSVFLVIITLSWPEWVWACAVCGAHSLENQSGQAYIASLLFMMSMPALVVGSLGCWIYFQFRHKEGTDE